MLVQFQRGTETDKLSDIDIQTYIRQTDMELVMISEYFCIPAVYGSKKPVAVLKHGKCVNWHSDHHEDQVKDCQGNQ